MMSSNTGRNWVFPVVGPHRWNRGSWMPNTPRPWQNNRTHAAIDIYAERGTHIVAPVGGRILSTSTSKIGGNTVRIQGDDGVIYYFAHLDGKSHLKAGSRVEKAEFVGFVGNTGSASGGSTHLHFSMRQVGSNQVINPISYLEGAYVLDEMPSSNFDPGPAQSNASLPPEEQVEVPYHPDEYGYASATDIADDVADSAEGPEPMTAADVVGGVLSSVSDMIAGGARMDYRGLGTVGVPQSQLKLLIKKVGQESAVSEDSDG